jgi:hypothetical protein
MKLNKDEQKVTMTNDIRNMICHEPVISVQNKSRDRAVRMNGMVKKKISKPFVKLSRRDGKK